MATLRKYFLLTITGLGLAFGTGCSGMSNTSSAALVGGGAGAGIGALAGAATGHAGAGALIGGAVGAVGGAIVGNDMDQKEKQALHDRAVAAEAARPGGVGITEVIE